LTYKLVCFDMDGVLFEGNNFWLRLHKALGTYEEGKELTEKYLKTDYAKLVKEVVGRLWKGKNADPYFDLVASTEYIFGVKDTFSELKKRGIKTVIISSGPKHLVERARDELGVDYVFSNNLMVSNGIITGEFDWPIGFGSKAKFLKEVCDKENVLLSEVVSVGDNDNDVEKAKLVGFSIAFNSGSDELRSVCDVEIKKKDLREILPYLS